MISRASPGEVDHPASRGADHEAEDEVDGGEEDHDDDDLLSPGQVIPLTVMDLSPTNRYNNLLFSSHENFTGSTPHLLGSHLGNVITAMICICICIRKI